MIVKRWSEVGQGDQIQTSSGEVWFVDISNGRYDIEIRSATTGKAKNVASRISPSGKVRVIEPTDPGFVRKPAAVCWDIETADAKTLFRYGPGFYRIGQADDLFTADGDKLARVLVDAVAEGKKIVGHNICAFDLVALARWHGLDLQALRGSIVDLDLFSRVFDPPPSGKDGISHRPAGYYGLDQVSRRLGGPGKTDDLKGLARKHGGFDKIPTDDPEYRSYLQGDIDATRLVYDRMPALTPYAEREMNVGLITATMMINGFRVDVPELHDALRQQAARKKAALQEIHDITGMPIKGVSPLASDAGKAAVEDYLVSQGLRRDRLPRTPKTGKLQTGREALAPILKACQKRGKTGVAHVLDLIVSVVGERTVYKTADDCRVGDRVHPSVRPTQASGRWSVTGPGLTVFGKRGGRHVERRIFLPEPGHVILSVDLDQVDARAVAAHSQDPGYMAIFQQGLDVHGEVAEELFGDRSFRELVKPISHGWNYGRSARAIAAGSDGKIPLDVAEHFDAGMRKKYPRLVSWQNRVRADAEAGVLLDNGFGRKMRADPAFAYTQAPALVGQGATRDILAEGMLRLPLEFWPYLRTVVHDELVFSVPAQDADEIGRTIIEAMCFDFMGVPITAGCSKPGANWAAVYEKG